MPVPAQHSGHLSVNRFPEAIKPCHRFFTDTTMLQAGCRHTQCRKMDINGQFLARKQEQGKFCLIHFQPCLTGFHQIKFHMKRPVLTHFHRKLPVFRKQAVIIVQTHVHQHACIISQHIAIEFHRPHLQLRIGQLFLNRFFFLQESGYVYIRIGLGELNTPDIPARLHFHEINFMDSRRYGSKRKYDLQTARFGDNLRFSQAVNRYLVCFTQGETILGGLQISLRRKHGRSSRLPIKHRIHLSLFIRQSDLPDFDFRGVSRHKSRTFHYSLVADFSLQGETQQTSHANHP